MVGGIIFPFSKLQNFYYFINQFIRKTENFFGIFRQSLSNAHAKKNLFMVGYIENKRVTPLFECHPLSTKMHMQLLATGLQLLEEIVTLVVNQDKCREVNHLDLPDSLHTQLRIFNTLDALDVVLR